jgi:hypothetical protein
MSPTFAVAGSFGRGVSLVIVLDIYFFLSYTINYLYVLLHVKLVLENLQKHYLVTTTSFLLLTRVCIRIWAVVYHFISC